MSPLRTRHSDFKYGDSTIILIIVMCSLAFTLPAKIFDWGQRMSSKNPDIVPVPHPGHDWPANHIYHKNLYDSLDAAGSILSLMLRDDTGPYDGETDSLALDTIIAYLHSTGKPLHYCFDDFEKTTKWENVTAMCSIIRGHVDPDINSARIGHYAGYAGLTDSSRPYPSQADRTQEHNNYMNSDLDVSMPNCYPYEYYEVHTSSYSWGTYISPNKRSALFWAPLEKFSVAKRNLPGEHELIPWIAGFVEWSGYNADPPSQEDCRSLLQHFRMRGADGFFMLISWNPNYPSDSAYEVDMIDAWYDLEWFYELPGSTSVLHLDTDKIGGLEWSGLQRQARAIFNFTNLTDEERRFALPELSSYMPDSSPVIPAFSHMLAQYITEPFEIIVDAGGNCVFYEKNNNRIDGSVVLIDAEYIEEFGGIQNWSYATEWVVVAGPGNVQFSAADSSSTLVTFSEYGRYTIVLNADNGDEIVSDTAQISVMQARVYPVPLNIRTQVLSIGFFSETEAQVSVTIYDIAGRSVWERTVNAVRGVNVLSWDGMSTHGDRVTNGTYYCMIDLPDLEVSGDQIHKIIVVDD
jgi:hypothetical protein